MSLSLLIPILVFFHLSVLLIPHYLPSMRQNIPRLSLPLSPLTESLEWRDFPDSPVPLLVPESENRLQRLS